jgi:hypothetical protein
MRENKALSQKVGLLKGMGVYKFFRNIYGYYPTGVAFIKEKRKKPTISSQIFINNDFGFAQEVEQEFKVYFECSKEQIRLKKNARQILLKKEPKISPSGKITDLLKLCLLHSTKSKIKQNSF